MNKDPIKGAQTHRFDGGMEDMLTGMALGESAACMTECFQHALDLPEHSARIASYRLVGRLHRRFSAMRRETLGPKNA
jgi:hypothetical protein